MLLVGVGKLGLQMVWRGGVVRLGWLLRLLRQMVTSARHHGGREVCRRMSLLLRQRVLVGVERKMLLRDHLLSDHETRGVGSDHRGDSTVGVDLLLLRGQTHNMMLGLGWRVQGRRGREVDGRGHDGRGGGHHGVRDGGRDHRGRGRGGRGGGCGS